jgi:hypothetical protein
MQVKLECLANIGIKSRMQTYSNNNSEKHEQKVKGKPHKKFMAKRKPCQTIRESYLPVWNRILNGKKRRMKTLELFFHLVSFQNVIICKNNCIPRMELRVSFRKRNKRDGSFFILPLGISHLILLIPLPLSFVSNTTHGQRSRKNFFKKIFRKS